MPWYAYKSGGWYIAVDALNQRDAAQHIKRAAPGATFEGEYHPPPAPKWSNYTAMVTASREEQIHAYYGCLYGHHRRHQKGVKLIDINGETGYLVDCIECSGTGIATIYDADGHHEDQCPGCGGTGEIWCDDNGH